MVLGTAQSISSLYLHSEYSGIFQMYSCSLVMAGCVWTTPIWLYDYDITGCGQWVTQYENSSCHDFNLCLTLLVKALASSSFCRSLSTVLSKLSLPRSHSRASSEKAWEICKQHKVFHFHNLGNHQIISHCGIYRQTILAIWGWTRSSILEAFYCILLLPEFVSCISPILAATDLSPSSHHQGKYHFLARPPYLPNGSPLPNLLSSPSSQLQQLRSNSQWTTSDFVWDWYSLSCHLLLAALVHSCDQLSVTPQLQGYLTVFSASER